MRYSFVAALCAAAVLSTFVAGCSDGSRSSVAGAQLVPGGHSVKTLALTQDPQPVDQLAFHNVEITFHEAASTKNLDLMMSLFANDATLTAGGITYVGKDQVRSYFATKAGSFQPQNSWVAYTPTQRMRINLNGSQGELYFECLYVDWVGKTIAAHTFADSTLLRTDSGWLIQNMNAGKVANL